jgi:hypothetical protein
MKAAVQHFMCMMSYDALRWLRDIFLQQFGQENQQVNEPGFLFSNCCKKKKTK